MRPASLTAEDAGRRLRGAGHHLVDAAIGFVAGMVAATVIAVVFVLYQPFEFAFMPIAMLLRRCRWSPWRRCCC